MAVAAMAQVRDSLSAPTRQTMVYLEHAETLSYDEERHPDAQVLTGDVVFMHDGAHMYCDSAYFYESTNSLDAFSHVRFVQGDTLFGFADVLYYDGNSKFARMRKNVKLIDKQTTLTTDSLNYDRVGDLAWYWRGGVITSDEDTLTSLWGQYISHEDQALFKTDVHLVNPRFVMDADTLRYNTKTHLSDILGPTTILYEEETTILTEKGWYNTETEESMLLDRSHIYHNDGKELVGDTIFYNKKTGYAQVIGSMEMRDTVQKSTLYGHYGEVFEHKEEDVRGKKIVEQYSHGFVTDSALMVDWSKDEYTYLHGDTLYNEEIPYQVYELQPRDSVQKFVTKDSIQWDTIMVAQAPDTIWRDTTYRQTRARRNVRIYGPDGQVVCDSTNYNGRDSINTLYGQPILWQENQQMSADVIVMYMKDSVLDHAVGTGNAIAIQQETDDYYNQMSGKEITAYMENDSLRRVFVSGNAETVFFPKEEDGTFSGMNKTQSSYVMVYMEHGEIERVVVYPSPTGRMVPLEGLDSSESRLGTFFWADAIRPKKPGDVFEKTDRSKIVR